MDHIPTLADAASALVLLIVSCLGIWHRSYEDTVVQRLGLCTTAVFSSLLLVGVCSGSQTSPATSGTLVGCAIFAFGCFLKYRRIWLKVLIRFDRRHPD